MSLMLPSWLEIEAWEGWCEMRQQMGKRVPFTERAKRIALGQLDHWHQQGYDTAYILNESTLKGWRGLFVNERTPRTVAQPLHWTEEQRERVLQAVSEAEKGARQRYLNGYKERPA